jgi:lipoyl(octanoyl) transferase
LAIGHRLAPTLTQTKVANCKFSDQSLKRATKIFFTTVFMRLPSTCWLYDAGLVPYQTAWDWQKQLVADRKANPNLPDSLILLEHPAVYTLGQGADPGFLKFDPIASAHELYRIERGGEVTHHCPGQLVGYPILNLQRHTPDLHAYLRQLEAVVIQVLAHYGLTGERIAGLTGVWVEGRKIAAIGIKVSRWITMHGFALNVCPDLNGFQQIVPCGISDRPVGSLEQWIPGITIADVRPIVIQSFEQIFQLDCQLQAPSQLNPVQPATSQSK